jgi:hypothetical protein
MGAISLQIIVQPANHILNGSLKNAKRYQPGDFVDIWDTKRIATLVDGEYRLKDTINPKFAFIHVTKIPRLLERVKEKLLQELIDYEYALAPNKTMLRRRLWHIPPSELPAVVKQKLTEDREITVTYSQVKAYIRKKIIQGSDSYATIQDDVATAITEEDM